MVLFLQEQAGGLQKYMQQLGKLPAFQKGLEQALGKNPTQELQNALSQRSALPQVPLVPIPGILCNTHSHCSWRPPCCMVHGTWNPAFRYC